MAEAQENCKVRCLVHFSAHTHCGGLYVLAENMDLTPSRQDIAVLLGEGSGAMPANEGGLVLCRPVEKGDWLRTGE